MESVIPALSRCHGCAHSRVSREGSDPRPYCAFDMLTLSFKDAITGEFANHNGCTFFESAQEQRTWKPRE